VREEPSAELVKEAFVTIGQACGKATIEMHSIPINSVNFFIFFLFKYELLCYRETKSLVINGKGDMINREDIRNRSHESY